MSDKSSNDARSSARLYAVQALYQMDIAKTPLETIIREFVAHRLDTTIDDVEAPEADQAYFEGILRGVVDNQVFIDRHLNGYLSEGWRLSRIDSTMRAILRCGAYELIFNKDVPLRVITSQYTDMAHSFFEGPEGGATNALLDRLGNAVKSGEIDLL